MRTQQEILPGTRMTARHAAIVYKSLPRYRIPFFERLREELGRRQIHLTLVYGQPTPQEQLKEDTGDIVWGKKIRNRRVTLGGRHLYWQPALTHVKDADLVIVEQASKLILNYVLLARQAMGGPKVAFWGHGRNFQQHRASRLGESIKRRISKWPHWWFAYNDQSAQVIRDLGYPTERTTTVYNSIASTAENARSITNGESQAGVSALAEKMNIAIFVGGIYEEKRPKFLVAACTHIRRQIPDFEIFTLGAGPLEAEFTSADSSYSWFHHLGPQFDEAKAAYLAQAKVFLLPGLVGLAIIDAFQFGLPIVTVDLPYHSPEIDYLEHGVNGLLLRNDPTPEDYSDAVVRLLSDPAKLESLQEGCLRAAHRYSLDNMVNRFADGIELALGRAK